MQQPLFQAPALPLTTCAGGVLRALETLLLEVARIRLHGITPRELSHAIADFKVPWCCG